MTIISQHPFFIYIGDTMSGVKMAIKQALVVDDSKTARVILKRMLEELDLVVDTTESADEAIDYLKNHHPDVIFMDHMMPGMDGFEAVRHIKKDSRTAVIPIMMYTSRGGDLYLSQARALGAVGIIPKTISPVGLKESLFKLGLIKNRRKAETPIEIINTEAPNEIANSEDPNKKIIDVTPASKKPAVKTKQQLLEEDLRENQKQHDTYIEDLQRIMDDQTIELHKSMWLGVESVGHEIFNRLNSELEEKFKKIETMQEEVTTLQRSNVQNKYLIPMIIAGGLLLLSLISNILLFVDNKQVATEVASMKKLMPVSNTQDRTIKTRQNDINKNKNNTAYQFIQWAKNKTIEYPYNELALNDNRVKDLDNLVKRALDTGFTGKIILQTHVGTFCMNSDLIGNYTLADSNLPVTQCQYIGNYLQPTDIPTTHQSLGFANYLSDSGSLIVRGIVIEVENKSRNTELVRYPEKRPETTAKEWNLAAQSNNRVTIILKPASKNSIVNSNQQFFE